jgi:hypothetical protein
VRYGDLSDVLARIDRARYHSESLRDILPRRGETICYPLSRKTNIEGRDYSFYIGDIEPIHPDVPIITGECLFNLRSALDHLVYQLHVRRYRGNVPVKVAERSAFPILDKPRLKKRGGTARLPTEKWNEIGTLGARQRTAIEFLQPYHRRNDRDHFQRLALADVNRLCNIDKHRHLHVVTAATEARVVPNYPPECGFRQHGEFSRSLESGAEVERWTFTQPPPKMEMHLGLYVAVGLSEGQFFMPLPLLCEVLINRTQRVIDRFAGLFPAP